MRFKVQSILKLNVFYGLLSVIRLTIQVSDFKCILATEDKNKYVKTAHIVLVKWV